MKRVLSSLLLVLLLLCGLTDRAEAAVTPLQKTASGSFGENPNNRAYFDPLLVLEMQRDRELWGYDLGLGVDVGPNLYAYVRQNPWSKFDPLGLWEGNASFNHWRGESKRSDASVGYKMYASVRMLGSAMNPAASDSVLRQSNREFGEGVESAREEINNSNIPKPLKSVAKVSLATGSAGHSMNPISAVSEGAELVEAVQENGFVQTAKEVAVGTKEAIARDPEFAVAGIGVGIITGKLKKPSLSAHKKALAEVHKEVGKLPKGEPGKFGSPQAGDKYKGYRLDGPHPVSDIHPEGSAGTKTHIDWWDRPSGKRKGPDSRGGKIPVED